MKLCVFQGTFNPIHNAHLRIAEFALEHYNFDKILFIPAFDPPHKTSDTEMSIHRLNMVKIAIKDKSKFEVSDIEFTLGGKSYTYLTICELYRKYNTDGKINFIIGTDAFATLKLWYEFDKLKKLVKFIVFIRDDKFDISGYNYLKKDGADFEFQTLPFKDISSTRLREKIKNRESIGLLVPKEEEEYIYTNGLYRN